MPQPPKLSYVLLSHNREKYIRAAIESAFAQDYEGELEYIFSDDCSTDRTFEIIKECVAAYKGSRRVVVTQPPSNVKTAANFNHALSFVQGDWVVRADDDDISVVDRCTVIGKVINAIPGCMYIATCSPYYFTDGEEEEAIAKSKEPCGSAFRVEVVDAASEQGLGKSFLARHYSYKAWNLATYRQFGKLPADAYLADDYIFYYRSAVMGLGVLVNNAAAVLVRTGSLNQSRGLDDNKFLYNEIIRLEKFSQKYQAETERPMAETYEAVSAYVREHVPEPRKSSIQPFLQALKHAVDLKPALSLYWEKSFVFRFRLNRRMKRRGPFYMLRLLPLPLFALCMAAYRSIFKRQAPTKP